MKSRVVVDQRRRQAVASLETLRQGLVAAWRSDVTAARDRRRARIGLRRLGGQGSVVRVRRRCQRTGRGRGVHGAYGVARRIWRQEARQGDLGRVRRRTW